MKKDIRKRLLSLGLSVMVSATLFITSSVQAFAYTETTGTVSTDNVKVRSSASTTASQVSSLKNGDKIDIVDESTDASGYVWYKIRVNKSEFGYVRSDLVSKAGGSSAAPASQSSSSNKAAASLPETSVTATEEKTATITADSVNVRKGAGTAYDSVGKVTKGNTVTVTGEATGTDNKTWYQVKFGNDRTGFIRSDLLEVGAAAAPEEGAEGGETSENPEDGEATPEEGSETTEAPESENTGAAASDAGDGNFSLVYTPDNEGNDTWYLYDNFEGYRVKVNELIDAAKSSDEVSKLVKTNNTYRTIMIILAVLIAALVCGLIFMALKLRDSLYYEDEEEEEEFDRYAQPARRRARDDDDDRDEDDNRARARRTADERTVRPNREEAQRASRPVRRDEDERPVRRESEDRPVRRSTEERPSRPARRDDYEQERQPRRTATSYRNQDQEPVREAPRRKSRNFIGDEDDFEFEFLDLDDDK